MGGDQGKDEPRLIPILRELFRECGVPYAIENVMGARNDLLWPVRLCGTAFGLYIHRHRLFELSIGAFASTTCDPHISSRAYALARGWDPRDMTVTGKGRSAGTKERWAEIMGWPEYTGTQHGLREAIPPAYTEWIGQQLMAALERVA